MDETDIGGPQGRFLPTYWTQVLKARDPASADRRESLDQLIRSYWKPLYFYVRRKERSVEAAKDLTQGFFEAFLERDFLKYVDRERGKFRTFLLTALEHFLSDRREFERAQKRGGGKRVLSLDFEKAETEFLREPATTETADAVYRREWAMRVLSSALQQVREELEKSGKGAEFAVLRSFLSAGEGTAYAEVAATLGVSEAEARKRVHRLRARYRETIREEIRATTQSDEETIEEMKELFQALS